MNSARILSLCVFILSLLHIGRAQGESILLDGVDDHAAIGTDTALASTQFTVETWFKRAAGGTAVLVNTTNSYPLVSRGNAGNFFLGTATDGRLHGQVRSTDNPRYSVLSVSPVAMGKWHHGALTYDGSILRLYLDGEQVGSLLITTTVNTTAGTRLGQINNQGTPLGAWAGQMDEVRVWDHARSTAEIALHRNVALTYAPGLLARWGFDGTVDPQTNSDGANSITSTLANGATYVADAPIFPTSAPTAAITSPASPLTITRGDAVLFESTASDADDAVVKVDYYLGKWRVGSATAPPFALNTASLPVGTSLIHAIAEDAAGHRNGSTAGVTVTALTPAGTESVHFDGATGAASVSAATDLGLSQFTVETWFVADGSGTPLALSTLERVTSLVFRGTAVSDANFLLGFRPSDRRLFGGLSNTGNFVTIVGNTSLGFGEWHHAALTFDGVVVRLYLDGNLDAQSRVIPVPNLATTKPLHLAALATAYNPGTGVSTLGGWFHGALDETRVWNHARPLEVIRRSRALRHPAAPGLVARWAMDESAGTTLLENASAAFPATLSGTTQRSTGAPLVTGTPPTASLTLPAGPLTLAREQAQALEATASDADGSIARVEYWDHATKLGESTTPPFTFNWSALPSGRRWISAVAIDDAGFAAAPAPVAVDVGVPAGPGGLYFDGTNRCASSLPGLSPTRFTVECWFRRENAGRGHAFDGQTLVEPLIIQGSQGPGTHDIYYLLGIRPTDGTLIGMAGNATATSTLIGGTPSDFGIWRHAALTYDGRKLRLYLDGNLQAEAVPAIAPAIPATPAFRIAGPITGFGAGYFAGNVDDVRVWNYARSAAEVSGARKQDIATAPGLLSRWAFDEGTGTSATSTGSSPITLSLTGTLLWSPGVGYTSGAAPTVAITSPAAASTLPIFPPATATVSAADSDGSVVRVELYEDDIKVGESTVAPFDITFTPQAFGVRTLRAVAVDDSGLATASAPVSYTCNPVASAGGVYFDGIDDFVKLPPSAELSLARYTVEAWVRRDGAGLIASNTGVIPIVARGRNADSQLGDFILGIQQSTGRFTGWRDSTNVANGTTLIATGIWYHVALTYDGAQLRLYVNGVLDGSFAIANLQPLSSANPSFGAVLDLNGARQGAFMGTLDEVRVWATARTGAEIAAGMSAEIHNAPGLVARWGFAENNSATTFDSGTSALHGALQNGVIRTIGVTLAQNAPPSVALDSPAPGAAALTAPVVLAATIGGEGGETLNAAFLTRELPRGTADFTIAVIPDIANYTASQNGGTPATLNAMLDWVAAERAPRNIVYLAHTGSLAAGGNEAAAAAQTQIASDAFARIENPATTGLPFGLPFGIAAGDGDTPYLPVGFDVYFPFTRYAGRPWFAGTPALNTTVGHLVFFSAGGMDFAAAHISTTFQNTWLQSQLARYPQRQFIIVFHDLLTGSNAAPFASAGQSVFSAVSSYANVALFLGGNATGEWRRSALAGGRPTHALSANFSTRPNGGDGWLRLLEFSSATGRIRVRTYSPTLGQYENDDDSDFTLAWASPLAPPAYASVATLPGTAPGSIGTAWAAPAAGRTYEWTAQNADAINTVTAPARRFSTSVPPGAQPPVISLTLPAGFGSGMIPFSIPLFATASSADDAIHSVEFFANGYRIQTDTIAPYTFDWLPAAAGTFSIIAVATDRRGLQSTSAPVTVTAAAADGTPAPVVSLTSPANNTIYFGTDPISLTATATASVGTVTGVSFVANDQPVATDTTSPYAATWTAPAFGTYEIRAIATTNAGTGATANPVTITVIPAGIPTITRQPYLQMSAPTAITIRWRTAEYHRGRVWYGTAPGALTSFADEVTTAADHEVRLTALIPGTRYYYGVGSAASIASGDNAATYFTTQPPVGRAKATRIWALGDSGIGNTAQLNTRDAYYAFTGTRDTDILMLLGDNAYNSGLDSEYQSRFFNIYEPLLRKTHTWATIGNHETALSTVHNPAYTYYNVFSLPTAAESGGIASGTEQRYSFDHANIHFICLDSMTASRAANGAMATWLAADIASTTARWIIAFWHHPPYTRGGYNSDSMTEAVQMRANLLPILEAHGVDLVLSGHDHNYERTWLISGNYGLASTFLPSMKKNAGFGRPLTDGPYIKNVNVTEAGQGTVYVVAGSAALLYAAPTAHPALAVGLNQLGTAVIDVKGNQLDLIFLRDTGAITDNFTIIKPYSTTDTDGDGMPDDYETEYGFNPANPADGPADNDGDTRANRDEFAAGTDPHDPGSHLLSALETAVNGYTIRLNTKPGFRYTIQRTDELSPASWAPVASNLPGTGAEITWTDTSAAPAGKRFYRVSAQPQ